MSYILLSLLSTPKNADLTETNSNLTDISNRLEVKQKPVNIVTNANGEASLDTLASKFIGGMVLLSIGSQANVSYSFYDYNGSAMIKTSAPNWAGTVNVYYHD